MTNKINNLCLGLLVLSAVFFTQNTTANSAGLSEAETTHREELNLKLKDAERGKKLMLSAIRETLQRRKALENAGEKIESSLKGFRKDLTDKAILVLMHDQMIQKLLRELKLVEVVEVPVITEVPDNFFEEVTFAELNANPQRYYDRKVLVRGWVRVMEPFSVKPFMFLKVGMGEDELHVIVDSNVVGPLFGNLIGEPFDFFGIFVEERLVETMSGDIVLKDGIMIEFMDMVWEMKP